MKAKTNRHVINGIVCENCGSNVNPSVHHLYPIAQRSSGFYGQRKRIPDKQGTVFLCGKCHEYFHFKIKNKEMINYNTKEKVLNFLKNEHIE